MNADIPAYWTIIAAGVPGVAGFVAWLRQARRLRLALSRLELAEAVARDNAAYVPDDVLHSPDGTAFRSASRYWSTMMVRVLREHDAVRIVEERRLRERDGGIEPSQNRGYDA